MTDDSRTWRVDTGVQPAARFVERYEGAQTVNALKRLRDDIRKTPEEALTCDEIAEPVAASEATAAE